ncbi:MAG: TPM domain-containing protein [Gluconacetobacter diazotrophicus]|nr:TPM domain-containing protein [Gluconacetobacter diazotrophicus]
MSNPGAFWRRWAVAVLFLLAAGAVRAEEVIPAKPTRYFNDYALAVKPETADRLNQELADFERQTSNQILVAIYPTMQTDSSVDDFCLRIFRAWQVGQKDKDNGAVLFVFLDKHKTWIQTGSGIQGALTDAKCKDITADVIVPRIRANDFDGAMTAGVAAMIEAAKGENTGDGQTQYQKQHAHDSTAGQGGLGLGGILFLIILFFMVSRAFRGRGRGTMYTGGGPVFFPMGGFGGGGGSSGGGWSSGGGSSDSGGSSSDSGSFSSGGGDTNGGGAGSDW